MDRLTESDMRLPALLLFAVTLAVIGIIEMRSAVTDPSSAVGPVVDYGSEVDPRSLPNAFEEELPPGYFQILSRDAIPPVYAPSFTTADRIGWDDQTDVIGVVVDGEAKAYPVSYLNGREMVNDEIAGEPLLVSW